MAKPARRPSTQAVGGPARRAQVQPGLSVQIPSARAAASSSAAGPGQTSLAYRTHPNQDVNTSDADARQAHNDTIARQSAENSTRIAALRARQRVERWSLNRDISASDNEQGSRGKGKGRKKRYRGLTCIGTDVIAAEIGMLGGGNIEHSGARTV